MKGGGSGSGSGSEAVVVVVAAVVAALMKVVIVKVVAVVVVVVVVVKIIVILVSLHIYIYIAPDLIILAITPRSLRWVAITNTCLKRRLGCLGGHWDFSLNLRRPDLNKTLFKKSIKTQLCDFWDTIHFIP